MGAPLGNQNAAKGKRWAAAIERAIDRWEAGKPVPTDTSEVVRGLDLAAAHFVAGLFQNNDLGYFKELGDRIDGKPKQQIEASGADGGPIVIGWQKP